MMNVIAKHQLEQAWWGGERVRVAKDRGGVRSKAMKIATGARSEASKRSE